MNTTDIFGIIPLKIVVDRRIMIPIQLCVSPIAIFLHSMMMYIIFKKRDEYTNIFYKMVFVLSITDIYWSLYFIYQGMCLLLGYCLFGETGNMIIATIAQYMFYLCMNLDLLIAVNRFSAVIFYNKHQKLFSPIMGLVYVVFTIIASAVESIPAFMYRMKYYPQLQTFSFMNQPSAEFQNLAMWIEMGVTYIAHAILLLLYFWSWLISRSQSMKIIAHKKERRLLIQALFSGIPCFVLMTFHHLIRFPLLELLGGDWCILNGPIVYLWFNRKIRNDFIEIIRWCFGIEKRKPPKHKLSRITLAVKSSQTALDEIFL